MPLCRGVLPPLICSENLLIDSGELFIKRMNTICSSTGWWAVKMYMWINYSIGCSRFGGNSCANLFCLHHCYCCWWEMKAELLAGVFALPLYFMWNRIRNKVWPNVLLWMTSRDENVLPLIFLVLIFCTGVFRFKGESFCLLFPFPLIFSLKRVVSASLGRV